MKIRPVGAELLHADRRTDVQTNGRTDKKLIVLFRYFANAPKIVDTNPHTELGFQFTLTVFEQ